MEKSEKRESRNKLILVTTVLIVLVLLIGIASKTFPSIDEPAVESNASESVEMQSNEVIDNTSDMEKLKSSEYTNAGFDNIQIDDSVEVVEEKIGKLEKLDIESEYDAYVFKDVELGSNYVFYFSNNQLKEVSVFLVE